MSASAGYEYGYKKNDVYTFYSSSSITATTEEGTARSSASHTETYKIENINEDTHGGYHVNITYTKVTDSPNMIEKNRYMEGDERLNRTYYYPVYGNAPFMFITTEWDDRGDEWKDYVNKLKKVDGVTVRDHTASEGVFTMNVEYDVPKASGIDFDGDGTRDEYTGTMVVRVEYNGNGVLSSYTAETNIKFDDKNTFVASQTISTAQPVLSGMVMYILIGAVCSVVALAIGFFIGKSRTPKTPKMETFPPAPPPPS
jgi:hypothetical protein